LAFSDLMALEAMACLRQHGLDWQALPLAGFDDILSGLDLPVDLSSVRAQESVATRAFHNLAAQMEHNTGSLVQTVLDVVLIEHRSKA
jgi:DNA-binding LacI/PurR family transcriptional regulator